MPSNRPKPLSTSGLHAGKHNRPTAIGAHAHTSSGTATDQTIPSLEIIPAASFSYGETFRITPVLVSSGNLTGSSRPFNRMPLTRQRLIPIRPQDQAAGWIDNSPTTETMNQSQNRTDDHEAFIRGNNELLAEGHQKHDSILQSGYYLDTSQLIPSHKGGGEHDVLEAIPEAEEFRRELGTFRGDCRQDSVKQPTQLSQCKDELAWRDCGILQNIHQEYTFKYGDVNHRKTSNNIVLKSKVKDFGNHSRQSIDSEISFHPDEVQSGINKNTDKNTDSCSRQRRLKPSMRHFYEREIESNPGTPRAKLQTRKRHQCGMVNAPGNFLEYPKRRLQIFSRFELLEERFFSPASPSHSVMPQYGVYPGLDLSLPEVTPTRVSGVTRSVSCNSRLSFDSLEEPLVKFRRVVKMVLILLKATFNSREGGQRRERYISLWASVLNGKFANSRRAYEMYGISFDPQEFKANTEVQVSTEVKAILSLEPAQRSQQQLRQALASLRQAVEEFSEFPITMQESLARVGRYEHFEAKRVIIRQGHLAENFYFILSGTAVVTILDTDKQTGEQTARTVNFLGKGKSFGELALMKKSRRTATVRCQEDVELLAVAREDFVDIFMHVERDVEPEHVTFLRSLHVMRGWPVEVLPANNPRVLVFTYVRRGIVLCKDSNASEWIYFIKSGSCRVIKALKQVQPQRNTREDVHTHLGRGGKENDVARSKPCNSLTSLPALAPVSPTCPSKGRRRAVRKSRWIPGLGLPAEKMEQANLEHYRILDSIHSLRHGLPLSGREISPSQPSSRSDSQGSESGENMLDSRGSDPLTSSIVFVDLLTLLPGDIYGLESCVFRTMGSRTTSTSLVSGGAEVIMINRKFFLDHTSEQLRKRLRREIRPLPSEETLQSQLETKISWEAFRHDTLKKTLQLRQKHTPRVCAT